MTGMVATITDRQSGALMIEVMMAIGVLVVGLLGFLSSYSSNCGALNTMRELDEEGILHLFRFIPEHGSRILHVVVNPSANPPKVVTLFFDRRVRRP